MERAKVLDFELQKQLVPYMKDIVPLPGARNKTQQLGRQQRASSCSGMAAAPGVQAAGLCLGQQLLSSSSSSTSSSGGLNSGSTPEADVQRQ